MKGQCAWLSLCTGEGLQLLPSPPRKSPRATRPPHWNWHRYLSGRRLQCQSSPQAKDTNMRKLAVLCHWKTTAEWQLNMGRNFLEKLTCASSALEDTKVRSQATFLLMATWREQATSTSRFGSRRQWLFCWEQEQAWSEVQACHQAKGPTPKGCPMLARTQWRKQHWEQDQGWLPRVQESLHMAKKELFWEGSLWGQGQRVFRSAMRKRANTGLSVTDSCWHSQGNLFTHPTPHLPALFLDCEGNMEGRMTEETEGMVQAEPFFGVLSLSWFTAEEPKKLEITWELETWY